MAARGSSLQGQPGGPGSVASGGQNPGSGGLSRPPASSGSGQATAKARRIDYSFEVEVRRPLRDHTVMVDVLSLVDGEFAIWAEWGGRYRLLPESMRQRIEREEDVLSRAHDELRALYWSHRLDAAGL